MAVNKSAANAGRKTHYSKPDSELSEQKYITKPENRIGVSKAALKGSVDQAAKLVSKLGAG